MKLESEGMCLQSRLVSIKTYANQNACGGASIGFVISSKHRYCALYEFLVKANDCSEEL
ncbi:hypothetical protein CY34DRAFT_813277 [Suillus luteus UH-Slu-Lm8-n1]|uniref:Uncharacterized protein n=1 Tax=Suillus luteus UH-Slu-Lm8-n1 TaxID=930992 RepID=A0A0C9ZX04_9AGAM|nr:hypothetical protein CY34DRAFT_813277 [Suillus luteus UH-Slu-Lm8-n1]